ncbi:ELMO domain-containing protein 2 [Ciona intestinalis]
MPENATSTGRKTRRMPVQTQASVNLIDLLYKITLLRCFIKWILRLVTGTCELQRITQKYNSGVCTVKIEESLQRSKFSEIRQMIEIEPEDIDAAIQQIISIKNISFDANSRFISCMKICLEQIHGYESLFCTIEQLRVETYDSCNGDHEALLLKLWNLLQPENALKERVSRQWGEIGFQGTDPKTDFRGMGMLGLKNLVYFAEVHNDLARKTLLHSHHPQYGYSYAIVGINLTSMAYDFMSSGLLRTHFFNTVHGRPNINHFNEVFSYLMFEFDKFWMKSEPENVMEFSRIRDEFNQTVEAVLKYVPSANLSLDNSS